MIESLGLDAYFLVFPQNIPPKSPIIPNIILPILPSLPDKHHHPSLTNTTTIHLHFPAHIIIYNLPKI